MQMNGLARGTENAAAREGSVERSALCGCHQTGSERARQRCGAGKHGGQSAARVAL